MTQHGIDNNEIDFKAYKWLVSSSLQKSLRRGRWDLVKPYMEFLWKHDRNYLTYRFGIILAEDVGIANQELVAQYLDTKLAKKKIDECGGLDFLLDIAQKACDSPKDRSSCDAAYFAYYHPFDIESGQEQAVLNEIALDSSCHYAARIQASWLILGNKRFKHENLPFKNQYCIDEKGNNVDDSAAYGQLIGKMLAKNPSLVSTVLNAYWTQTENICLGMPVMAAIFQQQLEEPNQHPKLKVGNIVQNMYVKETAFSHHATGLQIISSGIDGHTREGKTVYYKYLKQKNEFVKYLNACGIPQAQHIEVLSHCMFRLEGHEVNKRLYFPGAVQVMRECEQGILYYKTANDHIEFRTIRELLLNDIQHINQLRSDVINALPVPLLNNSKVKITAKI